MIGAINAYVSRYVIPFYYNCADDGYYKVVNKLRGDNRKDYKMLGLPKDCSWIEKGFWEKYKGDNTIQPEMDIYTYLLDVLEEDKESTNEANLGTSFVMKTNGSIFNVQYTSDESSKYIDFKCTDLGILIFRNGIGFIWYDVEFGKSLAPDEYIEFQHDFKELARTHSEKFRKKLEKTHMIHFVWENGSRRFLIQNHWGLDFGQREKSKAKRVRDILAFPIKHYYFNIYLLVKQRIKKDWIWLFA